MCNFPEFLKNSRRKKHFSDHTSQPHSSDLRGSIGPIRTAQIPTVGKAASQSRPKSCVRIVAGGDTNHRPRHAYHLFEDLLDFRGPRFSEWLSKVLLIVDTRLPGVRLCREVLSFSTNMVNGLLVWWFLHRQCQWCQTNMVVSPQTMPKV